MKRTGILLIVLVVLGVIAIVAQSAIRQAMPSQNGQVEEGPEAIIPEGVACTMDAKMCPDGSFVGRVPPTCEFAACLSNKPLPKAPVTTDYEISIGEIAGNPFLNVIPKTIIEDSRCPIDVMCIQQGTVRVSATVTGLGTSTEEVFTLGMTKNLSKGSITLSKVLPAPISSRDIATTSYRLTFSVTY